MARRLVKPASALGAALAGHPVSPAAREALLEKWQQAWRTEDPRFGRETLLRWADEIDDETLALLLLSPEERAGLRLDRERFLAQLGKRSGRALALALRDPGVADLVGWSVCRSGEPLVFDAFLSVLEHPGEAWSKSWMDAAYLAVRLFERRQHFEEENGEPGCTAYAVRLPARARADLVRLLDHEASTVREHVARALEHAFDPRLLEEDGLSGVRDALIDRVLDPAVGPSAYRVLARAPDRARLSALRALAEVSPPAWWLLACIAACGDGAAALERFDTLPVSDRCELAGALMDHAPARSFLLQQLRDEASPLDLRERVYNLFCERGLHGKVERYEPSIERARARKAEEERALRLLPRTSMLGAKMTERASVAHGAVRCSRATS